MNIYVILLIICLAVILGLALYICSIKKVGCIRINTSDPEKDMYSLELEVPFGELDRQKKVLFKIIKD